MTPRALDAPHDLELMQHADGELDARAAADLEAAVLRDPAAPAKLAALGEVGELVRGHLELAADAVPEARFEALWREIDKGLDRAAAPDDAIAREPSKSAVAPGFFHGLGRWFERFRGHLITGALSAGAVAALAIMLRPANDDRSGATGSGPIEVRPVGQRAPAIIESLDVPNGTGNVINVHDEDGNTTVIWVTPADTVEGT